MIAGVSIGAGAAAGVGANTGQLKLRLGLLNGDRPVVEAMETAAGAGGAAIGDAN